MKAWVMSEEQDNSRDKQLLGKWEEIKTLIESMDLDVRKNAIKGNQSAGIRSRRGLRYLKKLAHELLMGSVDADKERSTERKEKRDA